MKKIQSALGCDKGKVKRLTKLNKNQYVKQNVNKPNELNQEKNKKIVEIKQDDRIQEEEIFDKKKEILYSEKGCNLGINIPDEELLISENSPLLNPYEQNVLKFTKKDLVEFFMRMENHEDLKEYYNKNNLRLYITNKGSPLNNNLFMIKTIYTQKKSELGTNDKPENIIRLMYDVKERLKWDKILKNFEIFEGGNECFVVRTWTHTQMIVISEREGIEKRMIFKYQGVWYVISMSVPDNVY